MSGKFISFEGGEGCGKSTQIKLTTEWLKDLGIDVVSTFEPGDTALGKELRKLLLSGAFENAPQAELLMFLADRAQHVSEVINPALDAGKWVLCDRYSDSTIAYQLVGRKLANVEIKDIIAFAECGRSPDTTLWLALSFKEGLNRINKWRQIDFLGDYHDREITNMDQESLHFQEQVNKAFSMLNRKNQRRFIRISAGDSIEKVQDTIRGKLMARYPELS